ncbi:proline iminopeptidase-family hydrolase [Polymorphobacter fuscus]|uniref:Proline iminopeptidase-family hydrolase n=2 Tax=Sandarakinorhabdus fusca TaxID=1439888 RepID=A0A7C9KXP6_9SPHN|nr:alpha/beta fold hydrolase [Polymorphobacter fuscus]MQT15968.1 proline iminopeptidase-family hydrolase [Polymorphobacter fuscus]
MTRRTLIAAGVAAAAAPALGTTGVLLPGVRIRPDRAAMVAVPGGRVYVRINGDLAGTRPPIVLLHGGPGSAHWYFLNATALAGDRAVILYDQLDSGRSDTPGDPANWQVARFVAELEAVRAALGVARWHVLGASWGGTVALEYAARRPAALAGLVLQSPLVSTEVWLRDARILKDAMPPAVRDLLDRCDTPAAAPAADCDAATDAFNARHVRMRAPPSEVAAYKAALPRSFSPDIYNHMWGRAEFTATGTLRSYDGRPLLARLDGRRTLFVAGEHDEARPETVRGFAAAVPGGADFAMVADAAHSVMNDNPAAFLAVLRPWLAARDRRAVSDAIS